MNWMAINNPKMFVILSPDKKKSCFEYTHSRALTGSYVSYVFFFSFQGDKFSQALFYSNLTTYQLIEMYPMMDGDQLPICFPFSM